MFPSILNHCDGFLTWIGKVESAMEDTVTFFSRDGLIDFEHFVNRRPNGNPLNLTSSMD